MLVMIIMMLLVVIAEHAKYAEIPAQAGLSCK